MIRECAACGETINECMGFVKAGDLLEMIDKKREQKDVRELCGFCSEAYQWTRESDLIPSEGETFDRERKDDISPTTNLTMDAGGRERGDGQRSWMPRHKHQYRTGLGDGSLPEQAE